MLHSSVALDDKDLPGQRPEVGAAEQRSRMSGPLAEEAFFMQQHLEGGDPAPRARRSLKTQQHVRSGLRVPIASRFDPELAALRRGGGAYTRRVCPPQVYAADASDSTLF